MLAEFIDKITKLAREANSIQIVEDDTLGKTFVRRGDEFEVFDMPPMPRTGTLCGIDDLVAAATDENMSLNPEVFHDHEGAVLVIDRKDRHEEMTMPLEMTQRFQRLIALEKDPPSMVARSVIRMLRFELSGTGVDSVITALRKLDFTRKSDGRSDVQHGRESLGRSVEAAVQQASEIPENFLLTLSVYNNPGLRDLSTVDVQMGLHIDVHDETIQVRPLADELPKAILTAQRQFGEALRARLSLIPIFHGRP